MESCIINNKRCTKCCDCIRVPFNTKLDRLFKGVDDVNNLSEQSDLWFAFKNWTLVSENIAEKLNPFLFNGLQPKNEFMYFICSKLTDNGCSIYPDRPRVCRDYPYIIGMSYKDKYNFFNVYPNGEYTKGCTEIIKHKYKLFNINGIK